MDRMKCQELALVRMVKMGELEKRTNMAGITIWHSKPEKKDVKVCQRWKYNKVLTDEPRSKIPTASELSPLGGGEADSVAKS